MAQATSGERSTSQRRRAFFGLIAVLMVVSAFCAAVFILEPQIANPSAASCVLLIVGAPLLALVRFLDRRSRRRRISEIRDARRSGISIGSTRSRVEGGVLVSRDLDSGRRLDSGRHADAANREL